MNVFTDVSTIYLHRDFVDFRKAINGLVVIVEQEMQLSPFTDALFIFCNKPRDKLKILYWDKTRFALWYKRLDEDRFKWPRNINNDTLALSEQQLTLLLQGFDVLGHQPVHYQTTL